MLQARRTSYYRSGNRILHRLVLICSVINTIIGLTDQADLHYHYIHLFDDFRSV